MQKNKYKHIKLLLRIAISIAILVFFASKIDLKETIKLIIHSNYLILTICVLIYLIGQTICAYKWKLISSTIGYRKNLSDYTQYYFIGMFFNLFLPSTIGGDVGKAYYLYKNDLNGRKSTALYTVIAERFTGVAALIWIGTLAVLSPVADSIPYFFKISAICLSLGVLICPLLLPSFIRKFFKPDNWLKRSFLKDILPFWNSTLIFKCLFWSFLSHLTVIIIHILIGYSINIDSPLLYYFAFYPIVTIIGFIPISFNGIGIREGAYIYFLSLIGISRSAGLAFGLLWFAVTVICSLVGGIIFIVGNKSSQLDTNELEEFATNKLNE